MSEVKVGQVWKDNNPRGQSGDRVFEVVKVESDYYPSGRARCKLVGESDRPEFWAKLPRFNGSKRGYSLVKDVP